MRKQRQGTDMDAQLYEIQKRLKELGHDPGPLDGIWGTKTGDAIAAHLGIKKVPTKPVGVEAPWFNLASTFQGVREDAGAANDKDVSSFFRDAVGKVHADSVPWCAAFVGAMLERSGYSGTNSLMARSYLNWGTDLSAPRKGSVVVFKRGAPPSGHVGFVVEWTANTIKVLGGNQSDAVTVASFKRADVLGFRWPKDALAA
jgi:uncharacterized protein (TIGR02594 family)